MLNLHLQGSPMVTRSLIYPGGLVLLLSTVEEREGEKQKEKIKLA